jgi:hypothetical protein
MLRSEGPIGVSSASAGAPATWHADAAPRAGWRGAWPGIVLAAIGGLALYADRHVTTPAGIWLGPAVMPEILCVALLALGGVVAIEGALRRADGTAAALGRAGAPALAIVAAAGTFLLGLGMLGVPSAAGLSATIVAAYALHTRPVAFVWTVAAGFTVALLLDWARAIFKGAELWTF